MLVRPKTTSRLVTATTAALSLLALPACGDDPGGDPPVDEEGTWTWAPVEEALCGNGSSTGYGINRSSASDELLIYLQGGGICYTPANCYGPDASASNVDGFGTEEFAEFTGGNGAQGMFDRTDPDNPFRDYNFVFVPYCTGDVHAGNTVSGDLHFVGHANIEAFVARLKGIFTSPERVVLAGSSAGGFGAMFNFYTVATAFAPAPAALIDDSGPFVPLSATPQLAVLTSVYGVEDTLPPGCPKCLDTSDPDGGLHQLITSYADTLPGSRGSVISSLQDETIASNFSMTAAELEVAVNALADDTIPTNPDFRAYILDGSHHVWLFGGDMGTKLGDVESAGVSLGSFLQQQIDGDPAWANVRP